MTPGYLGWRHGRHPARAINPSARPLARLHRVRSRAESTDPFSFLDSRASSSPFARRARHERPVTRVRGDRSTSRGRRRRDSVTESASPRRARRARAFVRAREIRASFPRAASRGASVVRARACGARRRVAAPPPRARAAARFQPERARARDGAVGASNAMRDAVFRDRSLDLYLVTVYSYPKVGSFSYRVTSDDEP